MNFDEWAKQYDKDSPMGLGEREQRIAQEAWEASKAEERERILNIIRTQPIPVYARSIRLSGAYLDQIIEQIRKGE